MCPCFLDKIKDMNMEEMASMIGITVPIFRFLLCFVASIPISFIHRLVPGGSTGKHLYAAVTGAVLSYLAFGFSSNMHFLVSITIGYGSMILCRQQCGIITFVLAMGYLIGCHVYYMSSDSWKDGGMDATGSMMVITLKVISCSINYNDGLLKDDGTLRESQKKNRLIKLPSFIEYVGFSLCCGTHFAGPVYEMKDYLDWTERNGIWTKTEKPSASPIGPTINVLLRAGLCMFVYLYLHPLYPLSRFDDSIYKEWGFMERLSYQYMSSFTARWKYYFIWSVSEASMILSGLGFSGWAKSPVRPCWGRAKNVDILGVEFAKSAVEIPTVWNIHVSTWLRHYVYDRLVKKGKRPGFFQLLATQTISALWHGVCLGCLIFFVQSALMISGSKVIFRLQQSVAGNKRGLKKMIMLLNFSYTALVLNYSAVGFLVLNLKETISAYASVYYIGTIVPIVFIVLGNIIKPKPSTSRARKHQ